MNYMSMLSVGKLSTMATPREAISRKFFLAMAHNTSRSSSTKRTISHFKAKNLGKIP